MLLDDRYLYTREERKGKERRGEERRGEERRGEERRGEERRDHTCSSDEFDRSCICRCGKFCL
jgi:hypothetical protein